MIDTSQVTFFISLLRQEHEKDSITPERLGYILQKIVDLIGEAESTDEARAMIERIRAELRDDCRMRIEDLRRYADARIEDNTAYIRQVESLLRLLFESDPEKWAGIENAILELESNWHMEIDCDGGDYFVGFGETKHITCHVYNGYGREITSEMTAWKIERDTGYPADEGDTNDDDDWNTYKRKVRNFAGKIDLVFADGNDEDGLPLDDFGYLSHPYITGVTFTVTAMSDGRDVSARLIL